MPPRPPRTWISYAHGDDDGRVCALAARLIQSGVPCEFDGFSVRPPGGWTRYMTGNITDSDVVLVVASEAYLRRYRLEEEHGVGRGATFESGLLARRVYDRPGSHNVIPVLFRPEDEDYIVPFLADETRYILFDQFESLLRDLTDQPEFVRPPLGTVPHLAPRALDALHGSTGAEKFTRERADFDVFE